MLSKSLGVSAFRCSSLNTISIWSSQDALTDSQWRWTGNGRPRLASQPGRRLGACVEPLSKMRCRLRIRRHQTDTAEEQREEALELDEPLALKAAGQGLASVHQQGSEQLHRTPRAAGLPGLDGRLLVRADDSLQGLRRCAAPCQT